ncbi:MAG: tyrosine-type recombinase/integrase [Myxococcales bacterium]|jgi:integrase|nr:tyrosine-type recombinase/integrase [Myxococcales bacterium]
MNRKIDSIVKQANRASKRAARLRSQTETPTLTKLCAQRQEEKESPPLRVWGPYQDSPTRFRLKVSEAGIERSLSFATNEEAENLKEELLSKHSQPQHITIKEALAEWTNWLVRVRGSQPSTIENYVKMGRMLPMDRKLSQLTENDAKKLYEHQMERVSKHTARKYSVATNHLYLWVAIQLWKWAMEQGYCQTNPWRKVTRIGKQSKGKPQLRIDEARKLEALALKRAQGGDTAALGTLLMIYLGLRQGEVAARVARDIDDDGRVLWVPFGKTKNARRRLKIPEQIRPLVQRLAQSKRPDELLFYPASHSKYHQGYYGVRVKRLCRLAGVPEVVPHSLRGLHATLALEGGATADAVAKALGHSSFAMTEAHYASPSSVSNARSSRVAETLGQHPPQVAETKMQLLSDLLKDLTAEEIANMLTQLRSKCGTEPPLVEIQPT